MGHAHERRLARHAPCVAEIDAFCRAFLFPAARATLAAEARHAAATQRSGCSVWPMSARPFAIDSNWSAEASFSSPNRSAKSRCTAGTKDVPPVKNTFSMPSGRDGLSPAPDRPHRRSARDPRRSSPRNPSGEGCTNIDSILRKAKLCFFGAREGNLCRRNRT